MSHAAWQVTGHRSQERMLATAVVLMVWFCSLGGALATLFTLELLVQKLHTPKQVKSALHIRAALVVHRCQVYDLVQII